MIDELRLLVVNDTAAMAIGTQVAFYSYTKYDTQPLKPVTQPR